MRRFLKKAVPMWVVVLLIIALVGVSGAFAAYSIFTGVAEVTVEEPLQVEWIGEGELAPGLSWDSATNTLTVVGLKAGETTGSMFWITNSASVDIPITVTWTQTGGPEAVLGPGGPYDEASAESWIGCEWNVDQLGNFNPRTAIVPAGAIAGWANAIDYINGVPGALPFCAIGVGIHAGYSSEPGVYTFTLTVER